MKCTCCDALLVPFFRDSKRGWSYLECRQCQAVHRDEGSWLDRQAEKERYDLHVNDTNQAGYQNYLQPLLEVLNDQIQGRGRESLSALDFGCGPTQTMATLNLKSNVIWQSYDLHYFPDQQLLTRSYDFIVASEVFEHLKSPREELQRLQSLLAPQGFILIMTSLLDRHRENFADWHYRRDPTHIVFYSQVTMNFLARQAGFSHTDFFSDRVILMRAGGDIPADV